MQLSRAIGCLSTALGALALACSGQVELGTARDAGGGAGGSSVNGDAGPGVTADAGDPCAPAGVRLCGAGCLPTCPGLGCVAALDTASSSPTGESVCVSDLPAPVTSCGLCEDGDTCVFLRGQGYVCVAEPVCAQLFAAGAGGACVYADFSPYDGRPLAVASGNDCPAWDCGHSGCDPLSCGPGCGACATEQFCTGRSADFGYGICALNYLINPPCSLGDAGPGSCTSSTDHCMTWKTSSPSDTAAAADYGRCADDVECTEVESTGRMICH